MRTTLLHLTAGALLLPFSHAVIDWDGDTSRTVDGVQTWIIGNAPHTATPPTIDGLIGAGEWDAAPVHPLEFTTHSSMDPTGLEASFRAMWDETYLYILIEGTDAAGLATAGHRFELYISTAFTRKFGQWMFPGYEAYDYQIVASIQPLDTFYSLGLYSDQRPLASFLRANSINNGSYISEVRIAWSDLGGLPSVEGRANVDYIGFDVHVQRGTENNNRAKLAWAAPVDVAWASTEDWGTLRLLPAGGNGGPVDRDPGLFDDPVLGSVYYLGSGWGAWWGPESIDSRGFLQIGQRGTDGSGWIFHDTRGWLYFHPATNATDGGFIYAVDLGWLFLKGSGSDDRFFRFDTSNWYPWVPTP